MTDEAQVTEEAVENAHEPNTFSVRLAVYSVVGLGLLSAIAFGVTFVIYQSLEKPVERDELPEEFVRSRAEQPAPSWQQGSQQLEATERAAEEQLASYAWIDEEAGIARVPISRAMDIVLAEGLPAAAEGENNGSKPPPNDEGDRTP